MLIDEFLPKYDFIETHGIEVRASNEAVFIALDEIDFCESSIIRWLLFLRGMPSENIRLRDLRKSNFEILGKRKNKELLIGLAGKFWTLNGKLQKINSGNFREFNKKGFAKAVWNFSVDGKGNETRLTTETRIRCLDDASRRSFGFYWTFIQPFSGLIRREMLKIVKKKAEEMID
ncbi:MAG: hypothetical protein ACR2IA_01205 [Pyrinomonadaceae bacterium]